MGGVVSTGHDNDDLITNLLNAEYIKTPMVESVFRAVDRADYFLEDARGHAYKDLAWKHGHLHLSAPCIYSEVMEGLALGPGLSFLNLGSGTGYLSTMAGLLLGSYGINHGVEIHEDVIQYANLKLSEFLKNSTALDEFEFCTPRFELGNCLCLNSDFPQYDRVYCGAACPEIHANYMKNLIKVGGILVMPLNDKLLKIIRTSETTWDETFLLAVSFAPLIHPSPNQTVTVKSLAIKPLSLQEMCRSVIRHILRQNIEVECPDLKKTNKKPASKHKRSRVRCRFVLPMSNERDNIEEDLVFGVSEDEYSVHSTEDDANTTDEVEDESEDNGPAPRKRENFDSGLGEELAERYHFSDTDLVGMEVDSDSDDDTSSSSCDESQNRGRIISFSEESNTAVLGRNPDDSSESSDEPVERPDTEIIRRVIMQIDTEQNVINSDQSNDESDRNIIDSDSDSDLQIEDSPSTPANRTVYMSPYTPHMRAKILALPLPPVLKQYLNFYREL